MNDSSGCMWKLLKYWKASISQLSLRIACVCTFHHLMQGITEVTVNKWIKDGDWTW